MSDISAALATFRTQFARTAPYGRGKPSSPEEVCRRADRIVEGYIFFNQSEEVFVGLENIDWLGGQVEHQEWRAQLNRFFSLDPLIAAWKTTKDARYPARARALIEDWLDFMDGQDPARPWHPADNHLNLVIRIGNSSFGGWMEALNEWGGEAPFDEAFVARIFRSIETQLNGLIAHGLCPCGNQRLADLDTILLTGIRCPFMDGSDGYIRFAEPLLRNALRTQFLPDGAHVELCPSYHFWMSGLLGYYAALVREFPELDLGVDDELALRVLRLCPYFERFPINDSHPAYDSERCPSAQLERVNAALEARDEAPLTRPFADLVCPDAGFLFAFDDTNELFFDVSSYAGSHTHSSRLQVALNSGDTPLIIDPGIFTYEMSNPLGAVGKSTAQHSTITIDGLNQGPTAASLTLHDRTDACFFAEGSFAGGYWTGRNLWGFKEGVGEGRWAQHVRAVFMLRNDYILVLDAVPTEPGRTIHNHWQMAPFDDFDVDAEALSFRSRRPSGPNLLLQMVHQPVGPVSMTCYHGETEPEIRGWAGVPGQRAIAAPLVAFTYPGGLPKSGLSAMLLVPFEGDAPRITIPDEAQVNTGMAIAFDIVKETGERDTIAWAPGGQSPLDDRVPLMTDASFAFIRRDPSGKILTRYAPKGTPPIPVD